MEEKSVTFVSKVGFRHDIVDQSSVFSFRKVPYYLRMTRKIYALSLADHELSLHRADHRDSSPIEPFEVAVQLEKTDWQMMSVVFSRVKVTSLPRTLWRFTLNTISAFRKKVSRLASSGELDEIKIVCTFLAHPPSEIQRCDRKNLSTRSISTQTNDSNQTTNFSTNLERLSLDFSNLLKNETLPDVKLRCGQRVVPSHRSVLAARSDVFAAMFRNEMSESRTGTVDVKGVDEQVFQLFLKYLYSGKITAVPDDAVPRLYAASDQYAVHCLKTWCRQRMTCSLTEQNCVSVLTVADAHSDADFKRAVISFICSHEAVFKSDVWLQFSKVAPTLAMEVYQCFVECKTEKS